MSKLVRLWKRPCKNGQEFKYVLIWNDEQGKEKWKALGHADYRKAERQRAQKERELRMGLVEPESMKLSEFLRDSLARTRGQVRDSTLNQAKMSMEHFIKIIGDIDYRQVKHQHGERFIQICLDQGNAPATAVKKVRHLKRVFQLAAERGQLEENPFRYVKQPKVSLRKIRIFNNNECFRIVQAAHDSSNQNGINWELLIRMALCTGIRRGELLNTVWQNVDFEKKSIDVAPKENTRYTWEWHIKDTDRRTLPLTDEVLGLLVKHQTEQPEGCPYVYIPPRRYEYIQEVREQGNWSVQRGCNPVANFDRQFRNILQKARIDDGSFHDLRRTCLTNWFSGGLREYDVMNMAGHSSFETTRQFYLGIRTDLLEKTRLASEKFEQGFIAISLQQPFFGEDKNDGLP